MAQLALIWIRLAHICRESAPVKLQSCFPIVNHQVHADWRVFLCVLSQLSAESNLLPCSIDYAITTTAGWLAPMLAETFRPGLIDLS